MRQLPGQNTAPAPAIRLITTHLSVRSPAGSTLRHQIRGGAEAVASQMLSVGPNGEAERAFHGGNRQVAGSGRVVEGCMENHWAIMSGWSREGWVSSVSKNSIWLVLMDGGWGGCMVIPQTPSATVCLIGSLPGPRHDRASFVRRRRWMLTWCYFPTGGEVRTCYKGGASVFPASKP